MSKPQIALIGYGAWGRNHARVLRELGALKWVYDSDATATRCRAMFHDSTSILAEVLDDPDVEGVVIATPPATHAALAIAALAAGKHVLVEKPMATTVQDCYRMAATAEGPGLVLMVGHLMRYHMGFQKLLAQLDGHIGQREYVYSHRLQPGRVRTDSSSLWQLAPHDVSMLIAVAGMPLSVSCMQGVSRAGLADIVTATFEFANNARGHMFVSWLHPAKQREFMVIGEHGAMTFEQDALVEPLRVELQHFIGCISKEQHPLTDAADGMRVVQVLDACQRSMDAGGKLVRP